ncbi:Adaptive-response sensory-kinase SasA [bioreactor metagenome]|uniref:histidine kinase n=1 Tax=bioreactor metagenome TaxID=1076179 RepID=A0A645DIP4_9ZZZZ
MEEGIRRSGTHIEQKRLLITLQKEDCRIYADSQMAKQVFINYLTNAIDHTPEGKSIRIWWEQRDGKVILSVYNEGSTIEESDLSKIWTAFYKVDRSRKRTFGGTGIGLTIVNAIAQAHKTECGAQNEENGIIFYFVFDEAKIEADQSAAVVLEGSDEPNETDEEIMEEN